MVRSVSAVLVSRLVMIIGALGLATACAAPAGAPGTAATPAQAPASAEPGAVSAPSGCVIDRGRADRRCTPGGVNPDVTQATIRSTICVSGWTKSARPPAGYTDGLENQQKAGYGEGTVPNAQLEEDHLIPLELGGAPRDPANLWPEPRTGTNAAPVKDMEENRLHGQVCSGAMTLDAARQQILADWTH